MEKKIKKEAILDKLVREAKDGNFNNYIRKRNRTEISSIKKSISSRYNQERVISLVQTLEKSGEKINYKIKNVANIIYKLLFKYEAYMKEKVECVLTKKIFIKHNDISNIQKYIESKKKLYKELRKISKLKSIKLNKKDKNAIFIEFSWTKKLDSKRKEELASISELKTRRVVGAVAFCLGVFVGSVEKSLKNRWKKQLQLKNKVG